MGADARVTEALGLRSLASDLLCCLIHVSLSALSTITLPELRPSPEEQRPFPSEREGGGNKEWSEDAL
jgi:hypothetical protein